MEFEGTVWRVLPLVKGTSAPRRMDETRGGIRTARRVQPQTVRRVLGRQGAGSRHAQPGESVAVSANVESREYNGRWFTEARAWRITRKAAQQPQPQAPVADGLPPMDAFASDEPASTSSSAEVDDLPF